MPKDSLDDNRPRCLHHQQVSVYGEHQCALEAGHKGSHRFAANDPGIFEPEPADIPSVAPLDEARRELVIALGRAFDRPNDAQAQERADKALDAFEADARTGLEVVIAALSDALGDWERYGRKQRVRAEAAEERVRELEAPMTDHEIGIIRGERRADIIAGIQYVVDDPEEEFGDGKVRTLTQLVLDEISAVLKSMPGRTEDRLATLTEAARQVIKPPKFDGDLPQEWIERVERMGHPERCEEYVSMYGGAACKCGALDDVRFEYERHLARERLRALVEEEGGAH